MDTIIAIARNHYLLVIKDAAQGVMATYKGRPLGSIDDLGYYSFGNLTIATPYQALPAKR